MTQQPRSSSFSVLSLALGSCVGSCVSPPTAPASSQSQAAVLVGSRPDPRVVALHRADAIAVAAAPIAGGALPGGGRALNPAADAALASADGRELLSLLVACALPRDATLVATLDGSPVEFFGDVGLAPEWLAAPLSRSARGWVSACVLAELSGTGLAVPISLRGRHRALGVDCPERSGWSLEEGAFFGDLFVDPALPLSWFACRGIGSGDDGALVERVCTLEDSTIPGSTRCGFGFAGYCAAVCGRRHPGGPYGDCRVPGGVRASEVITVFLAP